MKERRAERKEGRGPLVRRGDEEVWFWGGMEVGAVGC